MALKIWWNLLRRDLLVLRRSLRTKAINIGIITITNLLVFAYFIPGLSVNQKYGAFIFYGAILIFGFFDIVSRVTDTLADVSGDNALSYMLVIPITPFLVFIELITYWASSTAVLGIIMIPLGKLILWNEVILMDISWVRFIPAFFTSCMLFGAFALWLISVIQRIEEVTSLWFRVINPLFMFGTYFFSWYDGFNQSAIIGYIMLVNPLVYAMEAVRSAALGPSNYIPFWASMLAMWAFIAFFTFHASYKLKKWLDCP